MVRPFDNIGDINERKELWKFDVIIHRKWKVTTTNKEYFELVIIDKHCHDIQVVVPTLFRKSFDSVLLVNSNYTMSNFQVVPNELLFKPTNHKYILKFISGTTIANIDKHEILEKMTTLTPFADIISGKWQKSLLTSTIPI
ncbi:unnamed protein product [Vicia faba]|uniref:Replication protein A 70 kDa DNA-binding subunit B/D first OB fold domain-containing protein n=1 Tax=Vicia faba TaxID=3906 RepID=A0AAV0ZN05_VICFA|nr:unnamed protein product [Vicia faba]